MELCRAGIVAGPSSGFALQGLLQFLSQQKKRGTLDTMRNEDGEIVAVFICPDSPFPYVEEYFEYLEESHFPKIERAELLINKPGEAKPKKHDFKIIPAAFDIEPNDAYEMAYPLSPKEAWAHLKESGNVALREKVSIIDIRPYNEFIHFHLPGSERMDSHEITENLSKLSKKWKRKKILLVCPMGIQTKTVAGLLRDKDVEAYSIKGGAAEWSALNLPRWRPDICNIKDETDGRNS